MQSNGYAVVTINFQDYARNNGTVKMNMPDNEKILKLQSLIDDVRNDGYQIVTVKEISNPPVFQNLDTWQQLLSCYRLSQLLQFDLRLYQIR